MDETEKKEEKKLTKEEIEAKIKVHRKTLEDLSTQGRRIQQQREKATQDLNQIIAQSNELVGAVKALQDLLGYADN